MNLSVIIPVYNRAYCLHECVDSLINIKSRDFEIILVDDGSLDRSLEVCRNYEKEDSRIKTIHQENQGVSAARNKGLKEANGQYVMFVDSDDKIISETVEAFLEQKNNQDLYLFDYYIKGTERVYQKRQLGDKDCIDDLYYFFLLGKNNMIWNNIYRNEIIKEHAISFRTDMKMGEDYAFNVEYMTYVESFEYCNRALYVYTEDSEGSAMNSCKIKYIEDYITLFDLTLPYYKEKKYQSLLNLDYYLNCIFKNLFLAEYKEDDGILNLFEKSTIHEYLIRHKYNNLKTDLKKNILKYHLYRKRMIRNLIKKIFY